MLRRAACSSSPTTARSQTNGDRGERPPRYANSCAGRGWRSIRDEDITPNVSAAMDVLHDGKQFMLSHSDIGGINLVHLEEIMHCRGSRNYEKLRDRVSGSIALRVAERQRVGARRKAFGSTLLCKRGHDHGGRRRGKYDVAIIGGGPGGATTGTLLKKYNAGLRVLILEREQFPRDHVGESQLPPISPILHEMGCWDKVEAANFPIKIGGTFRWGQSATPGTSSSSRAPSTGTSRAPPGSKGSAGSRPFK